MAIENFKMEVDVQIRVLKCLKKNDSICVMPYDLNDFLLVNLDSIMSLASMTHVAWSKFHELHHMNEKNLLNLSQI
jgi:hypothetical protein